MMDVHDAPPVMQYRRNTNNPHKLNIFKECYAHAQIIMFLLYCYLLWFWSMCWAVLMAEVSVWARNDKLFVRSTFYFPFVFVLKTSNQCFSITYLFLISSRKKERRGRLEFMQRTAYKRAPKQTFILFFYSHTFIIRSHGRLKKRYKDTLKTTLKDCNIDSC